MPRRPWLPVLIAACLCACATPPRVVPDAQGLTESQRQAYAEAARALDVGRPADAVSSLTPLLAVDPWHIPSHLLYNRALLDSGEGATARAYYLREEDAHPRDPARVLMAARSLPVGEALPAGDGGRLPGYRLAAELSPDSLWPRVALVYELLRRARAARSSAAADLDAGFAERATRWTDQCVAMLGEARGLAAGAAETWPTSPAAHGTLADALAAEEETGTATRSARLQVAIYHARRVVDLDPGDPGAHARLGGFLRRTSDDLGAAQALRTAVDLSASNPRHLANLGRVLLDLHEDGEARDVLEQAAPRLGQGMSVWINLGVARFRDGDLAGSGAAFVHAHLAAPESPRPFEGLALVRARQEDRDAAAEAMRRYLELGGRDRAEGRRFIRRMEGTPTDGLQEESAEGT